MGKYNTWLELYSAIVSVVVWEIPSDNWLSWYSGTGRCALSGVQMEEECMYLATYVYEYSSAVILCAIIRSVSACRDLLETISNVWTSSREPF